eukprot:7730803-Alexandrium_andersonii.AAC.1
MSPTTLRRALNGPPNRPKRLMQPKVAEICRMQLSATLGDFVQLCAPFGVLSRRLRAPKSAQSCRKPSKAA